MAEASVFEHIALGMMGRYNQKKDSKKKVRRIRAFFGTSVENMATIWAMIIVNMNPMCVDSIQPEHLLWGLLFLKLCASTEVLASIAYFNGILFNSLVFRI